MSSDSLVPNYVQFFTPLSPDVLARFATPKMKRIILHWTAGAYGVIDFELRHYHGIIDNHCRFHVGVPIAFNARPLNRNRPYAAHTWNFNEDSIGLSVDCMSGAIETADGCIPGPAPLTEKMYWAMIFYTSQIAEAQGLPIRRDTVFTHAEAPLLGVPQRGKWDITRLPFAPHIRGARAVGDKIRADILALRGERKALTTKAMELADTKTGEVTTIAGPGVTGLTLETQGEEMVNAIPQTPPPAAVDPTLLDQLKEFQTEFYTVAAYGVQWAGTALKYIAVGIAIATAVKYGKRWWRAWRSPQPNEVEKARGVD